GRGPRGSSLTVSAGLLSAAQPAELDGILAHELVHIANRDVLIQSTVSVIAGFLIEATRLAGWFQRAFLFVLAPVAASFTHLLLSPNREYAADRAAAQLCESPHGLADGLLRLEAAGSFVGCASSTRSGATGYARRSSSGNSEKNTESRRDPSRYSSAERITPSR